MTLDEARKAAPDDRSDNRPRTPPEPPKPRCIADDANYLSDTKKRLNTYFKYYSVVAAIMLIANLYTANKVSDMKIDPKRTDYAVQRGIKECERTLPRTQTCELSQLSFKVVEKKQW